MQEAVVVVQPWVDMRLTQFHSPEHCATQAIRQYEQSVGHDQNEWEPGSESERQRHLVSFGRIGQAKGKRKGPITTVAAVCAARYTAIVLPRHFCLIDWILSLQTIPSAIAVVIQTQLPARFVTLIMPTERAISRALSLSFLCIQSAPELETMSPFPPSYHRAYPPERVV